MARTSSPGRAALGLLCVLLCASAAACAAIDSGSARGSTDRPTSQLSLSASLLPNLGVEGSYERAVGRYRGREVRAEVHLAQQFLDDESFASDGNPESGDWTQAGIALRFVSSPEDRRSWSFQIGPEWYRARRNPNIIDEPGDYFGVRVGFGFETEVAPGLWIGPVFSVTGADGGREIRFLPQLLWGLRYRL